MSAFSVSASWRDSSAAAVYRNLASEGSRRHLGSDLGMRKSWASGEYCFQTTHVSELR